MLSKSLLKNVWTHEVFGRISPGERHRFRYVRDNIAMYLLLCSWESMQCGVVLYIISLCIWESL